MCSILLEISNGWMTLEGSGARAKGFFFVDRKESGNTSDNSYHPSKLSFLLFALQIDSRFASKHLFGEERLRSFVVSYHTRI